MRGVFEVALSVLAAFAASCAKIGDAHGTAAFGFWTPEAVILAADSKIVHLRGEPPESACKIRPSGRFYFLLSGFYGRPKTAFDAWKVVEESTRNAKTIDEASRLSERATLPLSGLEIVEFFEKMGISCHVRAVSAGKYNPEL